MINFTIIPKSEQRTTSRNLTLYYGEYHSPFGRAFIAATKEGAICFLGFLEPTTLASMCEDIKKEWPHATLIENQIAIKNLGATIFAPSPPSISVLVCATPFQSAVFKALLAIPRGRTISYSDVADKLGSPKAVRAVALAIGRNPVSYLIPCHRVIGKDGQMHGYRWGISYKKTLLAHEIP